MSVLVPVAALEKPVRQVLEDSVILYTAASEQLASRVVYGSYSRAASTPLSALLRKLSFDVKVQVAPITIHDPDAEGQVMQITITMVQRWYGPWLINRLLRFLGHSDPAVTLHFTTDITLSTITGKVVSHRDRVAELPVLPSSIRLFLGAPLPLIATLVGL